MDIDVEIVSKQENKLLDRQEVRARIGFTKQTPNRKDIRSAIGGKIAANPDSMILREVTNEFGAKQIKVLAHVYADIELLKKNEPYHFLVRDGLAQKKEKKTATKAKKEPK